MSVLAELDRLRSQLAAPGQAFELIDATVRGETLPVYRHLPRNIGQLIVAAEAHGALPFLVGGERRWSYEEALGQASGLARILAAEYGAVPGRRVALALRNSPEWIIACLATILTGATAVLVNSRGAPDEMRHALAETDCAVLIADPKRAHALAEGYAGKILIARDEGGFATDDGTQFDLAPAPLLAPAIGPDDPALILFTSGTTGRPKGAVLTHRGVCTSLFGQRHNGAAQLLRAAAQRGVDPAALMAALPQLATLAIFPLFHVSGVSSVLLGALVNGGKIVLMERWDPAEALALIGRERITLLQGPPAIFWDLMQHPGFAEADLRSLSNLGIGGQAAPLNLLAALARHFPQAAPGSGFGMTETNGAIASGTGEEYLARPEAAGRLLPGVAVRIVDAEGQDQDQPLGGIGEIWVKGALVMAGYWNDAENSAFSEGWLKTGDIGFLDAERFLTIVDRKKDVIIRGGENIYCAELERVFQGFPGVLEVTGFGVPDPRWGERAVVALVPQPGCTLTEAALAAHARSRLADYKIPSEFRILDAPFPRNVVGKIDKAALRATSTRE